MVLNNLADQTNLSLEDVEVPRHHHQHHQPADETILIDRHGEPILHQSRKRSRSRSSSSSSSGSRDRHHHHHEKHHQYCPKNVVFNICRGEVAVRSHTLSDQELQDSKALEEQAPVLHSTPETQETNEELAVQVPMNHENDQADQTSANDQSLDQEDMTDSNGNPEPIIEGTIADDDQLVEIPEANPPAQTSQHLNLSPLQNGLQNYRRKQAEIKAARKEQGRKLAEKARERRGQPFKHVSKSKRAGLVFPVTKVFSDLKNLEPGRRVTEGAAVYLASVLEYLSGNLFGTLFKILFKRDLFHGFSFGLI